MATVYSYIRFSSKRQEQGDSVRRQMKMGEEWLARNPQHTLDTSLRLHDLGVSAFRGANLDAEKGALGHFIQLVKQPSSPVPRGSILLIERLDRFSRSQTSEAYFAFADLVKAGITVQTLDPVQEINDSNINDLPIVLSLILQLTMAHDQSKEKSRRVTSAWDGRRERAQQTKSAISRRCPSWLKWDEKKQGFVLRPEGASAIHHIYKRTFEGCGQRALVNELNQGFKPIGRSGVWNGSFVQKVLSDRSVLGEFQPHSFSGDGTRRPKGKPIPDYYPRVVTDELFMAVSSSKASRRRAKGANTHFVNLFVGLIYGADGFPLHVQTSRTKRMQGDVYVQRRLVSYGHTRQQKGSCPFSLDYFKFESAVLGALYEIDEKTLFPSNEHAEDHALLKATVVGIDSRLAELECLLGDISDGAANAKSLWSAITSLQKQKNETLSKISEVEQALANEESRPLSTAKALIAQINSVDPHQRQIRLRLRAVIATLVEKVHVNLGKSKSSRRVGARISLTLKTGVTRVLFHGIEVGDGADWRASIVVHKAPIHDGEGAEAARLLDQDVAKRHAQSGGKQFVAVRLPARSLVLDPSVAQAYQSDAQEQVAVSASVTPADHGQLLNTLKQKGVVVDISAPPSKNSRARAKKKRAPR